MEEVGQLLGVYGVVGELRDDILQMARSVDEPGWWEHGDRGLARATAALASYESESSRIVDWSPMLVPGLLQTSEYARAWMLADGLEPGTVDNRTSARMRRQSVLSGGTRYVAFVGEPALRIPVGTHAVMARQLAALRNATRHATVSVRVVPCDVGPHRGQIGAFHQVDLPDCQPVILIELLGSSLFMDEPWQTVPYLEAATQLAGVALGETESAQLISKMQARWSNRAQRPELAKVHL